MTAARTPNTVFKPYGAKENAQNAPTEQQQ
jgi:hypothetical protein